MKQITFEIENTKDVPWLLQLAERLNIRAVIRDSGNELTERELTLMGMKLSEKSLATVWCSL